MDWGLVGWILCLALMVAVVFLIGDSASLRSQLARREWRKENCEAEFPAKVELKPKKVTKKRAKVIPLSVKG